MITAGRTPTSFSFKNQRHEHSIQQNSNRHFKRPTLGRPTLGRPTLGRPHPDHAHARPPHPDHAHARPFLKWAGGKRALAPEITKLLPDTIKTYWETVSGWWSTLLCPEYSDTRRQAIRRERRAYPDLPDRPQQAGRALLPRLQEHKEAHADKKYYYHVRRATASPDAVEVAARFIYLNRTCYNGLYRVNKSGLFNVPRGGYKNPAICDTDNLRVVSEVLQKAVLRHGDCGKVEPSPGDFIYCDPPYDGTFTRCDARGFGEPEQRRLRDTVLKWQGLGAQVMVSNADTPLIRSLYPESSFRVHQVSAPRSINSKGNGRGPVNELLITTYSCSLCE